MKKSGVFSIIAITGVQWVHFRYRIVFC